MVANEKAAEVLVANKSPPKIEKEKPAFISNSNHYPLKPRIPANNGNVINQRVRPGAPIAQKDAQVPAFVVGGN